MHTDYLRVCVLSLLRWAARRKWSRASRRPVLAWWGPGSTRRHQNDLQTRRYRQNYVPIKSRKLNDCCVVLQEVVIAKCRWFENLLHVTRVMVSGTRRKGNNSPCIDQESGGGWRKDSSFLHTPPDSRSVGDFHWLVLVLWVSFSALTLLVDCPDPCKPVP